MFPFSSHSSTVSFASGGIQSAGRSQGWMSGHACRRSCGCRGDGSCRCQTSCRVTRPIRSARSWSTPPPSRFASFADTGWSGELGRSRGRSWSRPMPRGGRIRGRWGRTGSRPQLRWHQLAAMRRGRARRVARTLRLNGLWSRRLGWGRHAPRIARMIGSRSAIPWSLPFARAVARWQRRRGFTMVDGVLSPQMWLLLQQSLLASPTAGPSPLPGPIESGGDAIGGAPEGGPGQQAPQDSGAAGWATPSTPADAPVDAMPPDAGGDAGAPSSDAGGNADAPPPDAGGDAGAGAAADDPSGEWYELARWAST